MLTQDPKGYPVPYGWVGYIQSEQRWMTFATEQEYLEYISE